MEMTEIKFKISQEGAINLEVINGQGESCIEKTKDLEVSLASAGKKTDEGKKPEFYEPSNNISVFNDLQ